MTAAGRRARPKSQAGQTKRPHSVGARPRQEKKSVIVIEDPLVDLLKNTVDATAESFNKWFEGEESSVASPVVRKSNDQIQKPKQVLKTHREVPKARKEAPIKARKEAPVKARKEAPVKARKEAPVKARKEAPVKARKEAPAKTQKEAPVKTPNEEPTKTTKEAPMKTVKEPTKKTRKESPPKTRNQAPKTRKEIPETQKELPKIQEDLPESPSRKVLLAGVSKRLFGRSKSVTREPAGKESKTEVAPKSKVAAKVIKKPSKLKTKSMGRGRSKSRVDPTPTFFAATSSTRSKNQPKRAASLGAAPSKKKPFKAIVGSATKNKEKKEKKPLLLSRAKWRKKQGDDRRRDDDSFVFEKAFDNFVDAVGSNVGPVFNEFLDVLSENESLKDEELSDSDDDDDEQEQEEDPEEEHDEDQEEEQDDEQEEEQGEEEEAGQQVKFEFPTVQVPQLVLPNVEFPTWQQLWTRPLTIQDNASNRTKGSPSELVPTMILESSASRVVSDLAMPEGLQYEGENDNPELELDGIEAGEFPPMEKDLDDSSEKESMGSQTSERFEPFDIIRIEALPHKNDNESYDGQPPDEIIEMDQSVSKEILARTLDSPSDEDEDSQDMIFEDAQSWSDRDGLEDFTSEKVQSSQTQTFSEIRLTFTNEHPSEIDCQPQKDLESDSQLKPIAALESSEQDTQPKESSSDSKVPIDSRLTSASKKQSHPKSGWIPRKIMSKISSKTRRRISKPKKSKAKGLSDQLNTNRSGDIVIEVTSPKAEDDINTSPALLHAPALLDAECHSDDDSQSGDSNSDAESQWTRESEVLSIDSCESHKVEVELGEVRDDDGDENVTFQPATSNAETGAPLVYAPPRAKSAMDKSQKDENEIDENGLITPPDLHDLPNTGESDLHDSLKADENDDRSESIWSTRKMLRKVFTSKRKSLNRRRLSKRMPSNDEEVAKHDSSTLFSSQRTESERNDKDPLEFCDEISEYGAKQEESNDFGETQHNFFATTSPEAYGPSGQDLTPDDANDPAGEGEKANFSSNFTCANNLASVAPEQEHNDFFSVHIQVTNLAAEENLLTVITEVDPKNPDPIFASTQTETSNYSSEAENDQLASSDASKSDENISFDEGKSVLRSSSILESQTQKNLIETDVDENVERDEEKTSLYSSSILESQAEKYLVENDDSSELEGITIEKPEASKSDSNEEASQSPLHPETQVSDGEMKNEGRKTPLPPEPQVSDEEMKTEGRESPLPPEPNVSDEEILEVLIPELGLLDKSLDDFMLKVAADEMFRKLTEHGISADILPDCDNLVKAWTNIIAVEEVNKIIESSHYSDEIRSEISANERETADLDGNLIDDCMTQSALRELLEHCQLIQPLVHPNQASPSTVSLDSSTPKVEVEQKAPRQEESDPTILETKSAAKEELVVSTPHEENVSDESQLDFGENVEWQVENHGTEEGCPDQDLNDGENVEWQVENHGTEEGCPDQDLNDGQLGSEQTQNDGEGDSERSESDGHIVAEKNENNGELHSRQIEDYVELHSEENEDDAKFHMEQNENEGILPSEQSENAGQRHSDRAQDDKHLQSSQNGRKIPDVNPESSTIVLSPQKGFKKIVRLSLKVKKLLGRAKKVKKPKNSHTPTPEFQTPTPEPIMVTPEPIMVTPEPQTATPEPQAEVTAPEPPTPKRTVEHHDPAGNCEIIRGREIDVFDLMTTLEAQEHTANLESAPLKVPLEPFSPVIDPDIPKSLSFQRFESFGNCEIARGTEVGDFDSLSIEDCDRELKETKKLLESVLGDVKVMHTAESVTEVPLPTLPSDDMVSKLEASIQKLSLMLEEAKKLKSQETVKDSASVELCVDDASVEVHTDDASVELCTEETSSIREEVEGDRKESHQTLDKIPDQRLGMETQAKPQSLYSSSQTSFNSPDLEIDSETNIGVPKRCGETKLQSNEPSRSVETDNNVIVESESQFHAKPAPTNDSCFKLGDQVQTPPLAKPGFEQFGGASTINEFVEVTRDDEKLTLVAESGLPPVNELHVRFPNSETTPAAVTLVAKQPAVDHPVLKTVSARLPSRARVTEELTSSEEDGVVFKITVFADSISDEEESTVSHDTSSDDENSSTATISVSDILGPPSPDKDEEGLKTSAPHDPRVYSGESLQDAVSLGDDSQTKPISASRELHSSPPPDKDETVFKNSIAPESPADTADSTVFQDRSSNSEHGSTESVPVSTKRYLSDAPLPGLSGPVEGITIRLCEKESNKLEERQTESPCSKTSISKTSIVSQEQRHIPSTVQDERLEWTVEEAFPNSVEEAFLFEHSEKDLSWMVEKEESFDFSANKFDKAVQIQGWKHFAWKD